MRRFLRCVLLCVSLCVLPAARLSAALPKKPKLVLVIVVDQCRYDYLTRFRAEFKGGFDRLLRNGASFTSAHDDFFPTLTAVAHSVLLTGAMPSATGIIGNDWFDRKAGKHVISVADDTEKIVGGKGGKGVSPRQLLVSTLGDELKGANGGRPRVIAISIKDRSAILLGGHKANGAFWFEANSGEYVTSSYYMSALPEWVQSFNSGHPAAEFLGAAWQGHKIPLVAKTQYDAVSKSPFGNGITEALAERALQAEKLGQREDTDLLAVSFSATDYVGHDYGPDSPEEHETLLATDQVIEKLLQAVDREVGLSSVLVVLTSDHGIPPMPDPKAAGKAPGGRFPLTLITDTIQSALSAKYGEGKWVAGCWDVLVSLNRELIAAKKLDVADVNRAAAEALRKLPHMARAYTREQLLDDKATWDKSGRLIKNGFNPERAADVVFLPEPFWMFTGMNTTHGTTYDYDTHVPLIFMGSGIRAGSYEAAARSNDIAPTLAEILGVPKPNASVGRVLTEMFAQ